MDWVLAVRRVYGSILLIGLVGVVLVLLPVRLVYHWMGGTGKFPYYYLDKWVGFP